MLKNNHISFQNKEQSAITQDQQIKQIQSKKQEGEENQEDGNTNSEEKIETESKNDISIPQFQTRLSQKLSSNFFSQKIRQNSKENKEDLMKQSLSQIKLKNEEKIEFKKQDNLSDLTYQQSLNFENLSFQDQSPNISRFNSNQKVSQLPQSQIKEKLIQMTSSTFKQNKTKQKLTKTKKSTLNKNDNLNIQQIKQQVDEKLKILNEKRFSQELDDKLFSTQIYKKKAQNENKLFNKQIIREIEQQIDNSLDFFKFFKDVLFLKKVALVLLSKDQLAAIQLVGIDIQDINPMNHKIQDDLQGEDECINYVRQQFEILQSTELKIVQKQGTNSKRLMKSNRKPSPSPNQKNNKSGSQAIKYFYYKKIDSNLGKSRNGSNPQQQKKTTKKESQKNYITIVKTNKTQNAENKNQAQTYNNISVNMPEQIRSQLGIKQVQSQNALSATSLKTIESPLQQDMITHLQNILPNKGVSMFANLTQQQQAISLSQSQSQLQNSQMVENSQNLKQKQSSPNKNMQNSQFELTYLQEYQQYIDYYNSNQTPYYGYEEITTPQQNNSYQIDEHINAISALKSKEISMVSNNESYQNLNEQNKLNKNDFSNRVNLNQSSFPFQQYNQQIQQTPYLKNSNQLSSLLQQNGQNQIQNNSSINNNNIQVDNRMQKSQLQSYLLKSNQIQIQIINNMNKQPLFNHITDNQLSQNSSHQNQENQYPLTQKQLSEINLKNKNHQEANLGLPNVSQIEIQKRWEVFDLPFKNTIANLVSEKGETYIYKFDPQGPLPELAKYKLNYKFNIIPCQNIAIDQKNGRLFVYDNDGNLLVFSQDLDFNEGKPIIKLSLEEKFPRKNPTLFVKTYDNYTLVFVIGGFFRQQTYSNIKVFKIERRNASIRYELSVNMMKRRRNPIVFTYSQKNTVNVNNSAQNKNTAASGKLNSIPQNTIETEKEYLILLGGNSYDPESDANVTGEFIEIDKIHQLINKRNNLTIDITDLIKTRLHSSYEDSYEISSYLTQGSIVTWHNEEQERTKILIFQEKLKNVLEIKKIDLGLSKSQNYGIIDIVYSDIIHKGHKGLMRIEQDYLSYFNQKGQDIHIYSLKDDIEVYSTKKKTNFFKPKGVKNNTLSNLVKQQDQEEEEVEEQSEDEEITQIKKQQDKEASQKLEQKEQVENTKKDSAKNIDVKDTKEQSQTLSDRKNGNVNNLSPENILSNTKLLNYDQNPFIESKRDYREEELKQLAESERQKKQEEDNKKEKDDNKKEQGEGEQEENDEEEEDEEEEENKEKSKKNEKKQKNKKSNQIFVINVF
ncbi:hypothetical protein ABPG74_008136 [Tetrahymena malaccensis]